MKKQSTDIYPSGSFENLNTNFMQVLSKEESRKYHIKRFIKSLLWGSVVVLVGLLVAGWIFLNADVYLFATIHPNEVRIRKVVYDQAMASGSAAFNDYIKNH